MKLVNSGYILTFGKEHGMLSEWGFSH